MSKHVDASLDKAMHQAWFAEVETKADKAMAIVREVPSPVAVVVAGGCV